MSQELDAILFEVASRTFENLAFMLSIPEEDDDGPPVKVTKGASVSFEGPFAGRFVVSVSAGVLPDLATNMLGLDEERPNAAQQDDALKELANIMCGNLLPQILGKEPIFSLHPPVLLSEVEAGPAVQEGTPTARADLVLLEGRAEMALFTEGPVPLRSGDPGSQA